MYELVPTGEHTYYIDAPVKIGLYCANDTDVTLIDSGNDKDAGRRILRLLEQHHWTLKSIINTHSNADHIGGNQYLQRQTGCRIFAKGIEAAFTKTPILEPSFLYGGYPCAALRHKFLMAAESDVREIHDADFPSALETIALPGHFFDMIGIRTPDQTVFLADCVSSENVLKKYRFAFIYDVAAYLKTLDYVETMQAKCFVASHAAATDQIADLVDINRRQVYENAETILDLCTQPCTTETILQRLCERFDLPMDFEQYALVGSTVRSYLSWLADTGRITVRVDHWLPVWQRLGDPSPEHRSTEDR